MCFKILFYIFDKNQKHKTMAELDAKTQAVLEAMKKTEKELKTQEIADLAGIEKQEVSKIITKLKKMDLVYSPKRCYYKAK